jgi:hypothetical protein
MSFNRLKTALIVTGVAAAAVPVVAQARQGADDPVGHVRHASHQVSRHQVSRNAAVGHRRDGSDDGPGHIRGGGDDGPNHR